MKSRVFSVFFIGIFVFIAITSLLSIAECAEYNWKLSAMLPSGQFANKPMIKFAEEVEKRTNGAIKFTLYEGTLGNQRDTWDMLNNNAVQFMYQTDAINSSHWPILNLLGLPFEAPGGKGTWLIADAFLKAGYLKGITDHSKLLLIYPIPALCLFFREKKVTTMEDLKGLKIRSASGIYGDMVKALGGKGISMPGGEVYMGLSTGVIDATLTGVDNVMSRKLYEVLKYGLRLPMGGAVLVLVMNKETWENSPKEIQDILEKTGREISIAEAEYADTYRKQQWEAFSKKAEIVTLSKEEAARWKNTVAGISEKIANEKEAKGYPAKAALALMRKVASEYEE